MASYSVIGAGSSSSNPIKLRVAYDTTYVTLCWIGKMDDSIDECTTGSSIEKYCQILGIAPIGKCDNEKTITGNVTWTTGSGSNIPIYYSITQYTLRGSDECKSPTGETSCAIGDVWGVVDDDNVTVYYEKETYTDYGEFAEVIKEIKSLTTEVDCDNPSVTINDCGRKTYNYKCSNTGCTTGTSVTIKGVDLSPAEVNYGGGYISIGIGYEKIITYSNCSSRRTSGYYIYRTYIPSCVDSETKNCCFDNYVSVQIPSGSRTIASLLGFDDDTVITYQGKTIGDKLTIDVLQKKNPSEECNTDCEYKITYCVYNQPSKPIKVEYETYWGSNIWTGTSVSPDGGRVKVSWEYIATYTPVDPTKKLCKKYTQNGKDFDIIEVAPCLDKNGQETFQGDIFYKERGTTPCPAGGTYVSTSSVTIGHETIIMNHITYTVNQTCSTECTPGTYRSYDLQEVNAAPCDTSVTGQAHYTERIIDDNCNVSERTGTEAKTVMISENETDEPRRIVTDYFIVNQGAGPCNTGKACNCDAMKIVGEASYECSLSYDIEPTCSGGTITFTLERHIIDE